MSNAQYRKPEPSSDHEPGISQAHFPYDEQGANRRASIRAELDGATSLFLKENGFEEIDIAINLLKAFAIEGAAYARHAMREEPPPAPPLSKPDAEKLPRESEAAKVVAKAARSRPIMDANGAARVAHLLIDLVQLRNRIRTKAAEAVHDMFVEITNGESFQSRLPVSELHRRLYQELDFVA